MSSDVVLAQRLLFHSKPATQHACLAKPVRTQVRPAPGPDEVNWPALWLRPRQRAFRTALTRPLLAALLLLVPVGLFSGGLQQLNHLLCPAAVVASAASAEASAAVWPWYCSQRSVAARALQRLMVAWLPTLLLSLWQGMVLPVINWLLIQVGGCLSEVREVQVGGLTQAQCARPGGLRGPKRKTGGRDECGSRRPLNHV